MKKTILALLLVGTLSLSGCASMLERDYVVVSPYQPMTDSSGVTSALRAENYQELVSAILQLVSMGAEQGVLNLYNYTQDVEADLTRACLEVLQEDPLGAYSVQYISHDYSLIVSYYEVNLQITYRRTPEQISSITPVTGSGATRRAISRTLTSFAPETVLRISYFTEDQDYIQELVNQAYYSSPATALGMPEAEINLYPDSGSQRIVEVILTYPADTETLLRQSRELTVRARTMTSGEVTAQTLFDSAAEGLIISPDSGKGSTYDALIGKESTSEGAALAYQLLCDQAGIECYFVRGSSQGIPYFWNIIFTEEGQYRHVDLSAGLFGLTDEELLAQDGYTWEAKEYPACSAPLLEDNPDSDEKNEEN